MSIAIPELLKRARAAAGGLPVGVNVWPDGPVDGPPRYYCTLTLQVSPFTEVGCGGDTEDDVVSAALAALAARSTSNRRTTFYGLPITHPVFTDADREFFLELDAVPWGCGLTPEQQERVTGVTRRLYELRPYPPTDTDRPWIKK